MKPLVLLLGFMASGSAFADGLDSMKSDVISAPAKTGGVGLESVLHLFLVIAVMFVLIKFGLPKVLAKLTNKLSPSLDGSIQIEESATIGTGGLYVIKVRGKTLLIGASSNGGFSMLSDLTESEQSQMAEPAFFELLDSAVVQPEMETTEPASPVSERLERLLRGGTS